MSDDRSALDRMLDEIYSRVGEKAPQPRLGATRRALELLGDPQSSFPIVHITGTNGKTSTSRITESILRAHGLRTALFTSPDLGRLNQRMVIGGVPVDDATMIEQWEAIRPVLELVDAEIAPEPPLTFFEALTVLAFALFADAPVDAGVIEVGMGGEWDSTNVADGQVAVLAPVDLDHTKRLGSTIAEIARTKSGIIKPGRSVVSAAQQPEALAEIERAAALSEADVTLEGRDFGVLAHEPVDGGQRVDVYGRFGRYDGLRVPLLGAHQAQNAAVAIAAVETFLGHAIDREVLDEGLATATSPGRLQVVSQGPLVVVDAAHNPHGVRALVAGLAEAFPGVRFTGVVAVLDDKDVEGMLRAADPALDRVVATTTDSGRAIAATALGDIATGILGADRVEVEPDVQRALAAAKRQTAGGVIVFGSITLIAAVLQAAETDA